MGIHIKFQYASYMHHDPLEYCASLAREHAYPDLLLVYHAPPPLRPVLLALLALEIELSLIGVKAKEELIAHMRFAWWREAAGRNGHPVVEALALHEASPLSIERMVDDHQQAWPQRCTPSAAYEEACVHVLSLAGRKTKKRWLIKRHIATRHRRKHGNGARAWLALKLMLG